MNLRRTAQLIAQALPRALHRRGFGVQSPWAYELVRDVLFEPLPYYAYDEQQLTTPDSQQLFRLKNHFGAEHVIVIDQIGAQALAAYETALTTVTANDILVVEHINAGNTHLWRQAVSDPRTVVTFDLGHRGIVTFDTKRVKQNYLL